jgi:adenylate cyclase
VNADGVGGVQLGERRVPTDEHGWLLVKFVGPPRTFPHVSVTDILGDRHDRSLVRDRIVLVGATAIGTHDLRSTPLSPVDPGLEIHGTVIDNLVTGRFLAKPGWSQVYDLLAIVGLASVVRLALPRDARHAGAPVRGGPLRPLRPRRPLDVRAGGPG